MRNPHKYGGVWAGRVPGAVPNEPALQYGEFKMFFEDYITNFNFTNICKYNDDDCHSYAFKNKPVP